MTTKKIRKVQRASSLHRSAGPSKAEKARKFILITCYEKGQGPTYTEIQKATGGVGDTSGPYRGLAAEKHITFTPGDYRSAKLTPEGVRYVEETYGVRRAGMIARPGLATTRPNVEKLIALNVALPRGVLEDVRVQLEERKEEIDTQLRAVDAALATG